MAEPRPADAREAPARDSGTSVGYFRSLDGLRALSVVAVVWHHTRPTDLDAPVATRGYLGVDVFFVISGFLITTLLMREERTHGNIRLGSFWMRRVLRLVPLWYAILAGLAATFWWLLPDSPMAAPFFRDLPWNATYTSNLILGSTILSVSWSLATEEQFYLLWPVLLKRFRTAAVPVLLFVGGLSVGLHLGLFDEALRRGIGSSWAQYWALVATPLPLVLGCALGLAVLGGSARSWIRALAHPLAPLAAAGWLIAAACMPEPFTEGHMRLVAQVAAAALVGALVLGEHDAALHGKDGRLLVRGLQLSPLSWIGKRAYGVYLLHMLVVEGYFALVPGALRQTAEGHRGISVFLATLVLSLAAAGLSYRFLEEPFLQLRSRYRRAPRP